jgi:hypothetical protein
MQHAIANLEMQLRSFETMSTPNTAEKLEVADRCSQLRRDIERIRSGQQKVGHP